MRTILFLSVVAALLFSCQREPGVTLSANRTSNDTGNLLIKTVVKYAGAATINDFSYDQNKKIVLKLTETTDNLSGAKQSSSINFYRDDKGRVFKIARKYDQPSHDSIFTFNFYESNASDRLVYSKIIDAPTGQTSIDSITYQYNSNDQIVKTTHYLYSPNQQASGADSYYIWDYDSKGNLVQMRQYSNKAGSFELAITYQFKYDDKINPAVTETSLLEYNWYEAVSPNNLIEQKNIYPGQPDEVLTTNYQYRSDGRPTAASFTGVGNSFQTSYYYQ
ncbi:MAG: hypothetical protein ACJ75B_01480 [Flavisolibacter sp.]